MHSRDPQSSNNTWYGKYRGEQQESDSPLAGFQAGLGIWAQVLLSRLASSLLHSCNNHFNSSTIIGGDGSAIDLPFWHFGRKWVELGNREYTQESLLSYSMLTLNVPVLEASS